MASKRSVAVLFEGDFYENEIFYYQHRFAEEGIELHFLTRLWGQASLVFKGHEHHIPMTCSESFEGRDPAEFDAIIVPAGMVSDRLRYTEKVDEPAPAVVFLERAFANPAVVKGILCHGMWLAAPIPQVVRGRKAVVHNNLIGDARNMGIEYQDRDLVWDGDLVTARTGGHCHLLARAIIDRINGVG
ncbi:MAG: DJ-1/PfpI family protein [Fibrobacteria bacterium]|nr:DJ-1/PfpI family protein [Fibrobacteria bacterium]